jgi:hypothetical protein
VHAPRITTRAAGRPSLAPSARDQVSTTRRTAARRAAIGAPAAGLLALALALASCVSIVLAGGASQVSLSASAGVPARLRLDGGAGSAVLGGQTYTGIAGGTVLTGSGWSSATSRYDIEAPAGVSTISVGSW